MPTSNTSRCSGFLALLVALFVAVIHAAPAPVAPQQSLEVTLADAPQSIHMVSEPEGPKRRSVDINNYDRNAVRNFYMNQYRPTTG